MPRTPLLALLVSAVAAGPAVADDRPAIAPAPPPDLVNYVSAADPSFAWKLQSKAEVGGGAVYDLRLTSQTWHDIKWEHNLQVFVPKGATPQKTMVLWNQGGKRPGAELLGLALAGKVRAPVAFLYDVPNQPLFGGKVEDALIAETFARYLTTGDGTWPLLFPMAKSLVRAMDALQAFAKDEWKADVSGFVVTGASKRGWTAWLTAATGDKRVKAIAPLVIDTLNMPVQMQNQVKAFGKPSEQIKDYTAMNLQAAMLLPAGRKLVGMVDPWAYREALTLPKMIVNGTNDPYWPQDALNTYWDGLKGEKHMLYVPNAGHDLREVDAKGGRQTVPERAVNTLAAFCREQVFGKKLPVLTWKHGDSAGPAGATLAVESDVPMTAARLWTASAPTRDFRKARWEATEAKVAVREKVEATTYPAEGFKAAFAEAEYEADGQRFTLSTQIRILEAKK